MDEKPIKKVKKSISITSILKSSKSPFKLPKRTRKEFDINDYKWVDEASKVVEKIESIVSSPRSHLITISVDKKIELAEKIDNSVLMETAKREKKWRMKDHEVVPEEVFANEFETEFAIYENRFILTLIRKLTTFVNNEIRIILENVNSISSKYQFRTANITATKGLNSQSNIHLPSYGSKALVKHSFLTRGELPFEESLKTLLLIKRKLTLIMSSRFCQIVQRAKPLKENDIHPTNILMSGANYAPCYSFYLKLLKIQTNKFENFTINNKDYTDFVVCSLLRNLKKLKYVFSKKQLKLVDGHIQLTNYVCKNKYFDLYITNRYAHIDLLFKLHLAKKRFKKNPNLNLQSVNKVSIDLISNVEYLSDEIIERIVYNHLAKGYNNSFIVTSQLVTNNENVIFCSPYTSKIDSNLSNMLNSISLVTEANNFIYSHLCPVCGNLAVMEEEKGNYVCPLCNSSFSMVPIVKGKEEYYALWIKRIKSN